jgi:hypothetical protein
MFLDRKDYNNMSKSFIIKAFVYKNKSGGTNFWREGVNGDAPANTREIHKKLHTARTLLLALGRHQKK